jgi:4'-phosphopantetheinyl transferase EntD
MKNRLWWDYAASQEGGVQPPISRGRPTAPIAKAGLGHLCKGLTTIRRNVGGLCFKDALHSLAEGRLRAGFAIETGPLDMFADIVLFPTEISANVGSNPRRWAAFRGGRACARAALSRLGLPPVAIPRHPSGAPIWPQGVAGSISHTNDLAAAIVAQSPPIRGLGLDIEGDEPLDDATMVELVCRPEELVPDCGPSQPANLRRGKLLFVVKEAVYKLYRPLADVFLDFQDVNITLDEATGGFRAELVNPQLLGVAGARAVNGSFTQAEGLFIALAFLHSFDENKT